MKITVHCINKDNMAYWQKPKNYMREMDFERDYLPGVVAGEMGNFVQPESLKAQSIAARSYAYQYLLKNPPAAIYDTSKCQVFDASRAASKYYAAHRKAVEDTYGLILTYNGKPANTHFTHSNGGRIAKSKYAWEPGGYADPWDDSKEVAGHGSGLSQVGAENMAKAGKTYREILAFYYPGTMLYNIYTKQEVGSVGETELTLNPDSDDREIEDAIVSAEEALLKASGGVNVVLKPNIGVQIATKNDCYTRTIGNDKYVMRPQGIVVHDTGAENTYLKRYVGPDDGVLGENKYKNYWNTPGFKKCAHAFIGKTKDGTVMTYQILPWNLKCWLASTGSKGSFNSTHIQFEICRDNLKYPNEEYFRTVRAEAVKLCAWLCQEYNIPVYGGPLQGIVSHREAHDLGYANNHGDPDEWMKKFGDNMDKFRADVSALLGGKEVSSSLTGWNCRVNTSKAAGQSLWSDTKKSTRIVLVAKGEIIHVKEDLLNGWVLAEYNGQAGYADAQYLVPVDMPSPPVDDDDAEDTPEETLLFTVHVKDLTAGEADDLVRQYYPNATVEQQS